MSDRYCPYCGELVPSNAVTCPKCFKQVPDEPGTTQQQRSQQTYEQERRQQRDTYTQEKSKRQYSSQMALALDVIPGFLGVLGLGQIYRNYRSLKGWFILFLGIILFTTGVMLLMHWTPSFLVNLFSSFSAFPLLILYTLLYIFAVVDILLGNVFRVR